MTYVYMHPKNSFCKVYSKPNKRLTSIPEYMSEAIQKAVDDPNNWSPYVTLDEVQLVLWSFFNCDRLLSH